MLCDNPDVSTQYFPASDDTSGAESVASHEDLANHPRYELLGLLGTGGMGVVYKARHRLMDRIVALKAIRPGLLGRPDMVARFQREMRTAAHLCHPNIAIAHDADTAGATHFLVLELVEGANLDQVLSERGPLTVETACNYARQVSAGLQHAYERGMVHRDIKPHNLMVTPAGVIKILDFGLARFIREVEPHVEQFHPMPVANDPEAASESLSPSGAGLVETGCRVAWATPHSLRVGTSDYRAPEEAHGAQAMDIRADIYSLGCTLYHFLSGRVPYPGGSWADKVRRHREATPGSLTDVGQDIPRAVLQAVQRMMAKDPAERFQTPAEVGQALLPFGNPCVRHILVVDDHPDARESMAMLLRAEGFTVSDAENGREAIRRLREGPLPHLILLDLRMPVMDGWQFLEERKKDAALANIPVILLSGADPGQVRAFAAGAVDFLRKPVDVELLSEKLHQYTDERQG